MDIASVVGLVAVGVVTVLMIGEDLSRAFNLQAFIVVFMGGIGLTLIALPLTNVINLFKTYWKVFFVRPPVLTEIIERIVGFAETARREGILALEMAVNDGEDAFLARSIGLTVDGTEPDLIMDIMETENQFMEERHQAGQKAIGIAGRNWAVFGGVAALVVLALQDQSGAELLGQAAQPLLYGLLLGGVFCWPAQRKLAAHGAREVLARRMMIEGIMAIQSGDNPRIVEHKLAIFIAPHLRPSSEAEERPTSDILSREEIDTLLAGVEGEMAGEEENIEVGEEENIEVEGEGEIVVETTSTSIEEPLPDAPMMPPMRPPPVSSTASWRRRAEWKREIVNRDPLLQLVGQVLEEKEVDLVRRLKIDRLMDQIIDQKQLLLSVFAMLGEQISGEALKQLKDEMPHLAQVVGEPGLWLDFEQIKDLSDREIQTLLREVDQKDLVIALKSASREVQERILGNMSERVRTFISEEMAYLGDIPQVESETVQHRIVKQMLQLAAEGMITIRT